LFLMMAGRMDEEVAKHVQGAPATAVQAAG